MPARGPNILMIMADQLAGPALPFYGHPVVRTPHLSTLAEEGVVFDSAYCNSPLCAPSRFSMMAGQLPSRIGAFDNAAEFPAAVPTFAHYLRAIGYRTCLAGKMHFVGPDQLHGFEERLTTDIYPSDFGWTPDWERPQHRFPWYHNMLSVVQAGLCERSNQLDYDEEVIFHAVRRLWDIARDAGERPFFLLVSFTHPHDPYAITREYWDRYDHDAVDPPAVDPIPIDKLDAHSRRLHHVCAMDQYDLAEAHVRNARHAYYGMVSYVDDKVGQLLRALHTAGLSDDTIVLFTSDHGDMLGERGMWYKMTFFEWSARIPLIVHAPRRFAPRRIAQHVSLVDLLPTLVDLANGGTTPLAAPPSGGGYPRAGGGGGDAGGLDGRSLLPLLRGDENDWPGTVFGEYLAEGALAPCFMIRRGRYKYIYSEPDPDQLYDLQADPHELDNLAGQPEHEDVRRDFNAQAMEHWDAPALRQRVIESQRQRRVVAEALMAGRHTPWDFQPYRDASQQYMRSHLDLDDLERRARFPPVEPPSPDFPTRGDT